MISPANPHRVAGFLSRRSSTPAVVAMGLLLSFLVGCELSSRCPSIDDAAPLDVVIAGYNANASRIPRLWSYARVAATFRETPSDLGVSWGSTSPLAEPNARLFLTKQADPLAAPEFLLLIKEAGREVSRLGTSTADNAYYFWYLFGDHAGGLWGQLNLAGAPNLRDLPIDPTQLLAALAVMELPYSQLRPPFVIQSYATDPCAYVLTFIDRQPVTNKLLARREIYFDRRQGKAIRPIRVMIYDDRGREVLRGDLADYQPIESPDARNDVPQPVMPTDIRLHWRKTGSEMHITLEGMTTEDRVVPEAYLLWDRLPGSLKGHLRQVDDHLPAAPGGTQP